MAGTPTVRLSHTTASSNISTIAASAADSQTKPAPRLSRCAAQRRRGSTGSIRGLVSDGVAMSCLPPSRAASSRDNTRRDRLKSKRPGDEPGRFVVTGGARLFRRLVLLLREPLEHLRIDAGAVLLHLRHPQRMDTRILILVFDLVAALLDAQRYRLLLVAVIRRPSAGSPPSAGSGCRRHWSRDSGHCGCWC